MNNDERVRNKATGKKIQETYSRYLLQCSQALVHSQSTSQCRGSRISNSISFKTVEESTLELVQVVALFPGPAQLSVACSTEKLGTRLYK